MTLQLKGHMKDKFFHEAYKKFMVIVVKKLQGLSADQLKASEKTARVLIKEYFLKIEKDLAKKAAHKKLVKRYPPLKKHAKKGHHAHHAHHHK